MLYMETATLKHAARRHLQTLADTRAVCRNEVDRIEADLSHMNKEQERLHQKVAVHQRAILVWNLAIEQTAIRNLAPMVDTVNEGLRMIVPDQDLTLHVTPEIKNDRQRYIFTVQDKNISRKGVDGMGGGVYAVISLLCRVVMIQQTNRAKLIVLDEQLKAVSAAYKARTSEFLQSLAKLYGMHILMVSHDRELAVAANKHYVVRKHDAGKEVEWSSVDLVTIDAVQSYFDRQAVSQS